MTSEFVRDTYRAYNDIGFLETIVSSPFFLVLKLFLLFFCMMVIVLAVGVRGGIHGGGFLMLFFLAVAAVLFLSVRSYQKYEKRSPVRRKVFAYRVAELVAYLAPHIDHVEEKKSNVLLRMPGRQSEISVSYGKNLAINSGGIVGGVPFALPRRPHPKTYFFTLNGISRLFGEETLNIGFSARVDDEDPVFGFGVQQYRLVKRFLVGDEHVQTKALSPGASKFMEQLRKTVEGTGLKGELEFNHGRFQLRLFDTIRKITIGKGKITYRHYRVNGDTERGRIADSQTAFQGVEQIFRLLEIT